MILLERGELRLSDRLGRLLPEFDNHDGKGPITLEQLLRHRSGLVADNPEKDYADGPDQALGAAPQRNWSSFPSRANGSSTATSIT